MASRSWASHSVRVNSGVLPDCPVLLLFAPPCSPLHPDTVGLHLERCNATTPERVESPVTTHSARALLRLIIAGFAGIGGGLAAINPEIVTAEVVSGARSGNLLLFTLLAAPILFGRSSGLVPYSDTAIRVVHGLAMYVGLIFLVHGDVCARRSVAGLIMMNLRVALIYGR
jgi:hypothetical protein